MIAEKSYLNFIAEIIKTTDMQSSCQYKIVNDKQEHLGRLEKVGVGQRMSWCLFLNSECYMSASCIDEVREKIRSLTNNKVTAL